MWSEDSAAEGAQLIKTIFMYTSKPRGELLRQRLNLIQRPAYHTRVWFHKPTWQSMLDRVEREGSIKTDHSAGLPGLMKLFIHELLPRNVTKSIFVDTDASTAIVMASHPDQNAPDWHNASRSVLCHASRLEKLRDLRMMDSSISPEAFEAMYGSPGGDGKGRYDNVRLGDQGYWWAIHLKYDFEVTSCLLQTYNIGLGDEMMTMEEEQKHQIFTNDTPQEGIAILPKLLHFNCLHGTARYYEWTGWSDSTDILTRRWGPALSYHIGYKWIWLNKGREDNPEHTLEVFSLSNVPFDDQLQLANKGLA
ncbi:hypothetical protein BJ912DRAFT_1020721 [Pholiota molesta]|nr:hypothetical protein BJ912DRAFT_1020721 [Pholiota molesta]